MKSSNRTVALRMAGRILASERPSAVAVLTVALALSTAPAWADGGNGAPAGAGQGGVDGALASATGQNAADGATAGGGGGGVDLTTGNGAPGGSGGTALTFNAPNGTPGATGGTGQVISTSGTISTGVSGGTGGAGSNGVSGVVRGGGGGGGGVGVSATADTVVTGSGSVIGGTGGIGGSNSNGGGGGGGVGVFSTADVTVDAGGSVTGGVGGRGSTQSGGGGGAAAIVLTGGGTVQNSGNLLGGTGGRTLAAAGGGDGGAGVLLLSGGTVINGTGATIVGGIGGQAGATGTAGDGGAGIKGANIAVVNAGTISGGAVGAGGGTPTAGKAIQFTGGVNSLEIWSTSTIAGNVVAFSAADTFKLGGDTSASFDVSQIGAGAKYDGFGFYEKTGNSIWTLTGTTTAVTPWTLSGGVLSVSADNNLGDVAGGLTFNGGVLQVTGTSFTGTSRTITWGPSGGGFDIVDAANDFTVSQTLTGGGPLSKLGAGTLILTADNSYAGGTTISGGTLQLGNGGTAGSISGDVTNNGALAFNRSDIYTFAGAISGSGSVNQIGTGTTVLTADNNYAGGTTITSGTLQLGNGGTTGSIIGDVANNGTLAFDRSNTYSFAGIISGSGAVNQIGTGMTVLTGANTYSGGTTISAGILSVSADNNLGDAVGGLTFNGGILQVTGTSFTGTSRTIAWGPSGGGFDIVDAANNFTVSQTLAGGGPLSKLGAGTLILTGDDSYTGGTTISAGTLQLGNGGAGGSIIGDVTNNATLAFNRSDTSIFAGVISGSGKVNQIGTGTIVLTGDNSYAGGTTITSGTLQLGNGGTAGSIVGNVINNGTLAFDRSNNVTFAGAISGSGTVVQQGAGSTTLTGTNTYSGGTTVAAGRLIGQAASFGTGDILDNAVLVFAQPVDATFAAAINGSGSLIKTGLGNLNLTGTSTLNGATTIQAGKLSVNGSLASSTVTVLYGGALGGNGMVGTTTLMAGGVIAPGNSIGTLTVNGNYVGAGGTLEIEAMLDGDASPADKLVITGNTSGTTNVRVVALGGSGAQTIDGIKIVDVGGTSAGTFSLQGDYVFEGDQAVVAGAYAYRLFQNGVSTPADGDWYLRSALIPTAPLYAPSVPVYEAYAGVLQSFNQLGTLQQRIGNRSWAPQSGAGGGVETGNPIWGRIEAAHSEFDPGTSTTGTDYDSDLWKLQAGLDVLLSETAAGVVIGGVTVHYGTVKSDVSSAFGLGSIDTTGYGVGGTLTWYGKNGFYVDTQAQLTWFDSDLDSETLSRRLADGNNGFGYSLGIEAGQKIALQGNWSLTPQAQLSYSSVDFDTFTDPYDAVVSNGSSDSLVGRIGLSADYENEWKDKAGQSSRSHVYGIANLYYDALDGSDVDVSGAPLTSETQALWGGLGLGGSLSWADDRYAVHGELLARSSLEDFGGSYAVGGSVGFKVKW